MVNQNAGASQGSFEARLLTAHPETALIYELGAQLRGLPMPIVDWEDLLKKLQTQEVDPATIGFPPLDNLFPPLDNLPDEPCVPPEFFPVYDEADLAVKLTAFVRISLRQAEGHGSTARLRNPMHKRFAAVAEQATGSGRRSGVFEEGSLLGSQRGDTTVPDIHFPWVVTLILRDCSNEQLLPWSWITDGFYTTTFDANAQFIALIDGMWSAYSLLVMREGYVNRLVVLDRATMAGTTQNICLNPA
ncbi:hypothetical protein [Streptomyces purpureus]|uniref:Uncharacterized protein n=1 Tax=Streptomyces purpureus TaxID=1951 RepID=A0A918LUX8_9ACTN|nr:hypothetical protein [Streptomyces purpureus]GGT53284.1 hypothetical protein GCM10014713_53870 [Streptomyces purpureus]